MRLTGSVEVGGAMVAGNVGTTVMTVSGIVTGSEVTGTVGSDSVVGISVVVHGFDFVVGVTVFVTVSVTSVVSSRVSSELLLLSRTMPSLVYKDGVMNVRACYALYE